MQLLPIHSSLQEKYDVNFILLIDTEGLQAPEREYMDSIEHDNKFATFVIGMANLNLITASGEITKNVNDILHTAVHAFIRMNQVELKLRYHIFQQHVSVEKEEVANEPY